MIGNDWDQILKNEFQKDYFKDLESFLKNERKTQTVFPSQGDVYNALKLTPLNEVKVVILGQDPYHGEGQAHGLSFSVENKDLKIPPSLKNIYKELKADLGISPPDHANLTSWAKQGVLLLNNVLTVRSGEPGSHRKKGWEFFTDKIVETLNFKKRNLVFILWGNDAKTKAKNLDSTKHLILSSAHPSPFSVRKFQGCRHFSKCNSYLEEKNLSCIEWDLPKLR